MKKTERVNLIMRYVNNRAHFTIAEIQREFGISRATAIRDIQQIEEMGFPLTTQLGRGGGYDVLQNQYLPKVRFTPDELRAIFISFMASKNSQLPYLQNRRSITEKLIGIASQTQQDELIELEQLIFFDNTNPYNPSILELSDAAPPILNQIISIVTSQKQLEISYKKSGATRAETRHIYVSHIFNSNGNWYLDSYDFDKSDFRSFRLDRIQEARPMNSPLAVSESEISAKRQMRRQAANLTVSLSGVAILRFNRLHPFGTALNYTDIYQQSASFSLAAPTENPQATDYIADWLLYLGDSIRFDVIPVALSDCLKAKLQARLASLE